MTTAQAIGLAISAALSLLVLRRNLVRALMALAPRSVAVELEAPPGSARVPGLLEPLAEELKRLGFESIGSHLERPRLGSALECFDFAHQAEQMFASAHLGAGGEPCVDLITPTDNGALVLTSNYRRPARDEPGRYSSGGMEQVGVERVFRAHLRRVPSVGAPVGPFDQLTRVKVARAWYAGPGGREIRAQNAPALLWTAGSIGMVAAAILAIVRTAK